MFYVGTPLGGIWKTTSAGVTWFPIFDQETSVDSVGAIQVAPSNPDIVYAGAGDPIGGSLGNGMWKSTDAGNTWQHIGLEDTVKIDSILVDPADPNLVIVSALGDATHNGGGVYRSTDGGQTWTSVLKPPDYDGTRDLQFAYDDAQRDAGRYAGHNAAVAVVAAVAAAVGPRPSRRRSSNPPTKARRGPRSRFRPSRAALRWRSPCTPKRQRMYIVGNNIENGSGLYRSDDGGATWQHMAGKDTRISNGQGAYSSGVFVDSQNPDILYTMSTAMYRSTDGGVTFAAVQGRARRRGLPQALDRSDQWQADAGRLRPGRQRHPR